MLDKIYKGVLVLVLIGLFFGLFTAIGEVSSKLYHRYISVDRFLDIKDMRAPDITTDQDEHRVVIKRNSSYEGVGLVVSELVLIADDGNTITEVEHFQSKEYFETDIKKVVVHFDLPDNIKPGTYRYYVDVCLQLPHNVKRHVSWKSNRFKARSP